MIPLTTLYDDYIDRLKFTEQKNPFEYIVPRPNQVGRNNKNSSYYEDFPSLTLISPKHSANSLFKSDINHFQAICSFYSIRQ